MRAIASLVSSLPLAKDDAAQFSEQFQEQITDALLVTSLATLTKGYLTHDEVKTIRRQCLTLFPLSQIIFDVPNDPV